MSSDISSVTSWFSLGAFLLAVIAQVWRRVLLSIERRIALAPEKDRLATAQALSRSFWVLGRPIDTNSLTKEQRYNILITQIRDRMRRFYVLSASAAALSVIALVAFLATRSFGDTPRPAGEREVSLARETLEAFYKRDFKSVYEILPEQLRSQKSFSSVSAELTGELAQFRHPPAYRHFESQAQIGQFVTLSFLAEFDSASTFRETVMFARDQSAWGVYRLDIGPKEWPVTSSSELIIETSASSVMRTLSTMPLEKQRRAINERFRGFFLPITGWRVTVDGVDWRVAEQTCDVRSHDETDRTLVFLKSVLGGCDLAAGDDLRVLGRISDVAQNQVALEALRFFK